MKVPEITTPGSLFSDSARFKAPVFQRYYVWGKKEWQSFIEDIETLDVEVGQFLGAIVLKDLGRLSGPTSPTTYLLIDGQQRMTTLYLVLLGLAKRAADCNQVNDAKYIWANYLVEQKSPSYSGWPKLVPTLQDRHTFYSFFEQALPDFEFKTEQDPEEKKPRVSSKLRFQWERINKYIFAATGGEADKFDKEAFDWLLKTIQDDFKLINITLEQFDDANSIFSRLNAKGVPLQLADLIRNEIFSKFGPKESDKAEIFFHKKWQPFEKSVPDDTLSAFFPIYAYIALKGKITKAAAFPALQKLWSKKLPVAILQELEIYSPLFASLSEYQKIQGLSDRLNEQIERLSRMPRTRVTWPFIIQVLSAAKSKSLSEPKAFRTLQIVEAFLVRRALVGREPTGLHAVFKVLWDKTKGEPSAVLSKIVTQTIRSPSDSEIVSFLKKERSDTRAILPYVLQEYERALVKARKYDPTPMTRGTIEHILPKNLGKGWVKSVTASEHARAVGLIGNLVPLSDTQNKSLQDQAWSEKRKRFKGSNFKSTQALSGKQTWTPTEIDLRTKAVSSWICKTWKELDSI